MPLPTTNLKLHCDASDTGNLFTTINGGGSGVHTGTPADGDLVNVWDDEGDGISDVALTTNVAPDTIAPRYRSGTPLMKNPCLDFDGTNDRFNSRNQADSANVVLSSLITASAYTVIVAFWAEVIDSTATDGFDGNGLFGDGNSNWGLSGWNDGGTRKLRAYNFSGADQNTSVAISTGASWIAVWTHGGGNLDLTVIADSTGTETNAAQVSSGDTDNISAVILVGRNGGFHNGRMGEFAIWNVKLTGTDLTDAKNYFKDKWLTIGTNTSIRPRTALKHGSVT